MGQSRIRSIGNQNYASTSIYCGMNRMDDCGSDSSNKLFSKVGFLLQAMVTLVEIVFLMPTRANNKGI